MASAVSGLFNISKLEELLNSMLEKLVSGFVIKRDNLLWLYCLYYSFLTICCGFQIPGDSKQGCAAPGRRAAHDKVKHGCTAEKVVF